MIRRLFVFLSLLLLLGSCTSMNPEWVPEVPEADEATVSKLEGYLEDGLYGKVLQDTGTLSREYPDLAGERIKELGEKARELLKDNYKTAVENGEWKEAVKYYAELTTIAGGYGDDADSSPLAEALPGSKGVMAELITNMADTLVSEYPVAALLTFRKALGYFPGDSETLVSYGDLALEEKNREVLRKIVSVMEGMELEVPAEYGHFLEEEPEPVELMKGTVTIWVNRGIKVESGMGYADRVIGSGFFIDRRGYLITNYHVIESEVNPEYSGFSRLYIRLPGEQGDKIPAEVVGWDPVF